MTRIRQVLKKIFSFIYRFTLRNKILLAISEVMGVIMTHIIFTIGFIFFAIIGIIYRLVSKDPLDRKLEKDRSSYWVKKPEKDFDPESYLRQF